MSFITPQTLNPVQQALLDNGWFNAGANSDNRRLKRFVDTVGVGTVSSGTAAAFSIDAASPFGGAALLVDMPAGNTFAEVQLSGLNIATFTGNVVWQVWIEDYTLIQQIQGFAGTAGYGRLYQQTHNINNSNTNRLTGSQRVVVGALAAGAANTFLGGVDTMADTKIRIFPGAAGGRVWVYAAFVPKTGRPSHMLTFDDCSVTWIANALPYLALAGLQETFAINTGSIGTNPALYLDNSQVQAIAAAGHLVASHNINNTAYNDGTGGTQTAAQYQADFMTSSATLSSLVGSAFTPTYHALVQGRVNTALISPMTAAGVKIMRGIDAGYNFPQIGLGQHVFQLKNQGAHLYTQAQLLAICENAKTYGGTVCWMIHEITQAGGVGVETSIANFRFLCEQIGRDVRAGLAVCTTPPQLARELYMQSLADGERWV